MGVEDEHRARPHGPQADDGLDGQDRVVPVVDAAEEDGRRLRVARRQRPCRLDAERCDAQELVEVRIAREGDGIHASDREQHAEVEETLRLGSAEKEVAARQGVDHRGMVVREHFRAARGVVVQVLDDVRIVKIDHRGDRLGMCEVVIGDMPLQDGHVVVFAVSLQRLRRDPVADAAFHAAGIAREEGDLVPVREQSLRDLQKADADAGGLAASEGLRTDEEGSGHVRPFIRSTSVCSFHVREP